MATVKNHSSSDATEVVDAVYSRALTSDHARRLAPGKGYVIYTSDNAFEKGDWPVGGFEESEGADSYMLPSGGKILKSEYGRLNSIMDSTDFDGYHHGFHYGISVRTTDELSKSDFERLKELGAAYEIDVPKGAILIDTLKLSDEDGEKYESYYVMLTPDGNAEDLY